MPSHPWESLKPEITGSLSQSGAAGGLHAGLVGGHEA